MHLPVCQWPVRLYWVRAWIQKFIIPLVVFPVQIFCQYEPVEHCAPVCPDYHVGPCISQIQTCSFRIQSCSSQTRPVFLPSPSYRSLTLLSCLPTPYLYSQSAPCTFYQSFSTVTSKNFQCKITIIFLSISLNMCFGCSKEPSLWDGSFEYPQHMFWLRNKKKNSCLLTPHLYYSQSAPCTFYQSSSTVTSIGPVKQKFSAWNCNYFLIHQFKHVFWVFKRTVSLRRFFWVPTTYVLIEK